jgi:hypothetical protein
MKPTRATRRQGLPASVKIEADNVTPRPSKKTTRDIERFNLNGRTKAMPRKGEIFKQIKWPLTWPSPVRLFDWRGKLPERSELSP